MNLKETVYIFIKSDNMKELEIKTIKPRSTKVKIWRILKRYEKETGKDPEIALSIERNKVILTKDTCNAIFVMKDGREISAKDLMKG